MLHNLTSQGYSPTMFSARLVTTPRDTRTNSNGPNTVPFPTRPLPGSTTNTNANNGPLTRLPGELNSSHTHNTGDHPATPSGSIFRRFFKKLDPRRLRRSRHSAQDSGTFEDSSYSSHSNVRITESPCAVAYATLNPPPGLEPPSARQVAYSAFADPSQRHIYWLSPEQGERVSPVGDQAQTYTPYPGHDPLLGIVSPAGSPDMNMAVAGVPPRLLTQEEPKYAEEPRSDEDSATHSSVLEHNENDRAVSASVFEPNIPLSPSHSARAMVRLYRTASEEALSAPRSQSPCDPASRLLHYPLYTGVDMSTSRLHYDETLGPKLSRHIVAHKLDAAGNPTSATIRFDFVGALADDKSGKPVYAAVASSTHKAFANFPRQVAIKMMRKESVFWRHYESYMDYPTIVCEAQAMRKLGQNGARFAAGALATFQDVDYFYIVSRWYHGSLHDYIKGFTKDKLLAGAAPKKRYVMDQETFRFYAGELLLAMQELRAANIVHADIKPDNIFVTPTGHLALADFDRAHPNVLQGMNVQKCAYEDVLISHNNGTALYKAPEINSPTDGVTPRADMFSLGVTLLEFALQIESFFSYCFSDYVDNDSDREGMLELLKQPGWKLLREKTNTPKAALDDVVFDFISKLVVVDPKQRLTIKQAKRHPLFRDMDWEGLRDGIIQPPLTVELGELPECSHIQLYDFPALYPARADDVADGEFTLHDMQKHHMVTFSEFGEDWIAPMDALARRGGPRHGDVRLRVGLSPEQILGAMSVCG